MGHFLIRATLIPVVIQMIQEKYHLSETEALDAFYRSATAKSLEDDDTGLYGQSPLFLFGLFSEEYEAAIKNKSDSGEENQ